MAHTETTPFDSQLLNFNSDSCPSGGTAAAPIRASLAPACVLPGTAYTGLAGTIRPPLPGTIINGTSRQKVAGIGVPQQPSVDNTHGFINTLKYKVTPDLELWQLQPAADFRYRRHGRF